VRKGDAEMVAAAIRTIFAQPTGPAVRDQLDSVAALLSDKFSAVAAMLTDAKADLTAFVTFPEAHWKKLWSTNPLELEAHRMATGPLLGRGKDAESIEGNRVISPTDTRGA